MGRPGILVSVIASCLETTNGLEKYLCEAGVPSRSMNSLLNLPQIPEETTAVVLFPDDFSQPAVVRGIEMLRRERPRLLIVVISSAPQMFQTALAPDGRSALPLVLPKPAFGWSILDAIRAHVPREAL